MRSNRLLDIGEILLFLVIIGFAAYFRLSGVATNPGWYTDEGTDIDIAHHLQMGEVQYFAVNQSFLLFGRPPLFQGVLALAFNVFGTGIETLRGLTGTLGVISVALLYWVVRRTGERTLALLAALILAIYPNAVVYSRLGYNYNLLAPLILLAFWGMWEYYNNPQRRWLVLAALALGIGGLSNLSSYNFALPLLVVIILRRWRDALWTLPLIAVPFILYCILMLLVAPQAFLFDIQYTSLRIGNVRLVDQISGIWLNFISLTLRDPRVYLGVIGLFVLPIPRLRSLSLLALLLPLFTLGRTVIFSHLGYYYFIPLMPFIAIGIASLIKYGALRVFKIVQDAFITFLAALSLPKTPFSLWFQKRLTAIVTMLMIFYLVIGAVITTIVFNFTYLKDGFPTLVDEYLLNPDDARQVIDYVNQTTQPDDVVIASPGLAWALDANAADFQMALAYTGVASEHIPGNLPPDRWEFDASYTNARFVVIDNYWTTWGIVVMDDIQTLAEDVISNWTLVFAAGAIQVYENPALQ